MKKIILGLFFILFSFSFSNSWMDEEEFVANYFIDGSGKFTITKEKEKDTSIFVEYLEGVTSTGTGINIVFFRVDNNEEITLTGRFFEDKGLIYLESQNFDKIKFDELVRQMKKGNKLTIDYLSGYKENTKKTVSLKGFTKAFKKR